MKAAAHSRPFWLVLAGGFLLLLLFVIAVRLLTALAPAPQEDAARAAERTKAHQELEAENAKKLQNYAWVDKAKGTLQIPIERAMELAIVELNSKKPTAAGPIATPVPSPAASPAASPAPAPPPTAPAAPAPAAPPAAAPTASPAAAPPAAPSASPAAAPAVSPAAAPTPSPAASPAPPAAPAAPTPASTSATQAMANL
jgi:outer membrane biosynthesis protein TonB